MSSTLPSYNPRLRHARPNPAIVPALLLVLGLSLLVACKQTPTQSDSPTPSLRIIDKHSSTLAIDRIESQLADAPDDPAARMSLHAQRWPLVQRAVAYQGATHRDAFYGSRSYFHTGSTRGLGWALDHVGDLDDAFYIATKGNVRVAGDVNADIEIAGNSIVHILGDLDATLDLQGICEVIIAGNLTQNATIICDGQLELFVGGNSKGILGSTQSSTLIIDGDAAGTLQTGAPATTLTVTGDLIADVPPPKNKDTILTLRVDGYTSSAKMRSLAAAGFTRINATLGISDTPPGLYPQDETNTRPNTRWVVLRQRLDESSKAN